MKQNKITRKGYRVFALILPFLLLGVMGCSSDDENKIVDQDLTYLKGNYVGTWNSKTPIKDYVDFPISARVLTSDNNELTGTFFYTRNFSVCCSDAEYDGTFTAKIDGKVVKSFRLDDVQRDCEAVFTGTGIVRDGDNALVVDITGTDCKGAHVGQIILVRQ